MKKISVFLILLFIQFLTFGQTMKVTLSQKDTAVCIGTSLRVSATFYIGSFKYIGSYGTSDYFIDTLSRSWSEARTAAQANSMDLWMIDDDNENNNVHYMIPNKDQTDVLFWIGLFQDPAIEKKTGRADSGWHWIDGRSLDPQLTFWASGQPDNAFGLNDNANVASIGLNGSGNQWSDMTDILPAQYFGYAIAERPHSEMILKWSTGSPGWYIDITPSSTSDYSLSVTYENITTFSPNLNILVNSPKAVALFEVDKTSNFCYKKNNIDFINKTASQGNSISYTWDFGDGTTATSYYTSHNYPAANTYVVSLKATDVNGCSTKANANVDIKSSPDFYTIALKSGSSVFCDRDSVILNANGTQTKPGVYNWYLSPSSTIIKSGSTYTAKVGGTYLLEYALQNGCKDTTSVFLRVNPLPALPTISIGSGYSNIFCQTDSTKLLANSTSSIKKYLWYVNSTPAPTTITETINQIYYPKAPTGMSNSIVSVSYLVRVIDIQGCTSDFSLPISVSTKPSPTASISSGTSPTTFCEGDSIQITLTQTSSTNVHEWYKDNILFSSGMTSIIAKSTGTYKIKETNSFLCSVFSNQINVVVNKFPIIPSISPDFPVQEITSSGQVNFCSGSTQTLRTSSVSGATYQWSLNNSILVGYTGISATVNKEGSYTISVKVNGCASQSAPIILGILPLPNGTLDQPSVLTVCDGYDLMLTAKNASKYQWYLNDKKIIGAISDSYNAVSPGTYKVEFFSDKGCSSMSTNTILLSLIEKPTAAFTYDLNCVNTLSKFTNQSVSTNSGSVSYLWKFQNGQTSNLIDASHTFPVSGQYNVKLTVTPLACPQLANTISANISVESPLPAEVYKPINAQLGKPLSLIARSFGELYEWKPSNGFNSPYIRIPILTPSAEQLYTVKITNKAGCVTVDSQLVRVFDEQDVFVAGGFTPNNDGRNDRIYPILVGIDTFYYLKIFNRWGNLVFQTDSTDPEKGWDGRFQGKDQPADTYTFILIAKGINGNLVKKSGSIILIR